MSTPRVADLTPDQLARQREATRARVARHRARKRAAQAPDARPLTAPVLGPDADQLRDPAVRTLLEGAGGAWRHRHGLRLPPSAGQLEALELRLGRLRLRERLRLAAFASDRLAAIRPRRRGERSWWTWAAVLAAVDQLAAALAPQAPQMATGSLAQRLEAELEAARSGSRPEPAAEVLDRIRELRDRYRAHRLRLEAGR